MLSREHLLRSSQFVIACRQHEHWRSNRPKIDSLSESDERAGREFVALVKADYGYLAAVEEGEEKDIRAIFETNFFGAVALIRAGLLPLALIAPDDPDRRFAVSDRRFP